MNKWTPILNANNIRLKLISTKNCDAQNSIHGTNIKYEFMPLCQMNCWKPYYNDKLIVNNTEKNIPLHHEIDYVKLLQEYNSKEIKDNYHMGLTLTWNNIVRRKNISHLNITNFSKENLRKMLLIIVSKIILKYQNKYYSTDIPKYNVKKHNLNENEHNFDNNIIIVNAWNEWNEQAILEPNNITGYENLETIYNIINSL
jgi:hypothetical protein